MDQNYLDMLWIFAKDKQCDTNIFISYCIVMYYGFNLVEKNSPLNSLMVFITLISRKMCIIYFHQKVLKIRTAKKTNFHILYPCF